MPSTTQPDIWLSLIPLLSALAGGLIATAGAIGGQLLTHSLSERKEENTRLRDRFRELVDIMLQHDHWLEMERKADVSGGDKNPAPAPLPRALVLVAVNFPELLPEFRLYSLRSTEYRAWMAQAAVKRLAGDSNVTSGFSEAYKPYARAFSDFQDKVADFARSKKLS